MQVFKFGGASVSSAVAIRNTADIIRMFPGEKVVVVSALGKTTNALEELVRAYFKKEDSETEIFESVKQYHQGIMLELTEGQSIDWSFVETLFDNLQAYLRRVPSMNFDYEYDQIVSFGELISTAIISSFYNSLGIVSQWMDIRQYLITDCNYRDANVKWQLSEKKIKEAFNLKDNPLIVTQGFIGGTTTNQTTTLGREGSDYSAAILGNILDAQDVTIWKNVPGVLNADPKFLPATQKIDELSYREAIELAYSGAQLIHPKTIKPLQNKNISLRVKSFENPQEKGSIIHAIDHSLNLVPVFIHKQKQALITLTPKDFSFINVHSISDTLSLCAKHRLKISLIQQSAIDFSLAFDEPEQGVEALVSELRDSFGIRYNTGLELVTIRYYTQKAIAQIISNRSVYIEQKTRKTARLLLK